MSKQKELKLRHEFKLYINLGDYYALKSRLRAVAALDSHVGEGGTYRIRSLYFDNFQDKALREKIDGLDNREKFRIRYYNDNYSVIKLEKKSKIHGLCAKRATNLSKEQCEKILNGDILWMKDEKDGLLVELYAKMKYQQLKPRIIIDYTREPYIYNPGNVRITIDSDIRTGLDCRNLFHQDFLTINVPENQMILEVKYDEFLPDVISHMIQLNDRKTLAYSKYAAGRMYS